MLRPPRVSRGRGLLAAGAAAAAALTLAVAPSGAGASTADPVVDRAVSFTVQNVNHSKVACAADGRTYTVRGTLVAPESVLSSPKATRAVTLYLHGLSFGEFFWHFRAVKGYDYAQQMARRGQASLIVDRLGYHRSDKPNGFDICAGSRADVAHQIVQQLRSGDYSSRAATPDFGKVFLAGHSFGGQIAQVEAYSFGDIDGLVVISYTDVGATAQTKKNAAYAAKVCAAGGVPATPTGPPGYAPFGAPSQAKQSLFSNVDPAVLKIGLRKLTKDPCGDGGSFTKATKVDLANVSSIHVPTLLVQGGADALFAASKQPAEAALYTGTDDLTTKIIPNTAHAVTLERTHKQFVQVMDRALTHFESVTTG